MRRKPNIVLSKNIDVIIEFLFHIHRNKRISKDNKLVWAYLDIKNRNETR